MMLKFIYIIVNTCFLVVDLWEEVLLDMTLEQKKHQEEYYKAKNRYENATYEKRRAENEIIDIRNRKPQLINKINQLNAEKKCNLTSLEEISKSVKTNGSFEQSIKDTETKLETASNGFLAIGESSLGKPQNLTTVFDGVNRSSKNNISSAFVNLKRTQALINNKINDINSQIKNLQTELENKKSRERSLQCIVSEKQRTMNNAAVEMAYHKKHMYWFEWINYGDNNIIQRKGKRCWWTDR